MKKHLLLLLLSFSFIFAGWQIFKNKKYNECIKACRKNNSCVEIEKGKENFYGFCKKWSSTECNNICVKKYK